MGWVIPLIGPYTLHLDSHTPLAMLLVRWARQRRGFLFSEKNSASQRRRLAFGVQAYMAVRLHQAPFVACPHPLHFDALQRGGRASLLGALHFEEWLRLHRRRLGHRHRRRMPQNVWFAHRGGRDPANGDTGTAKIFYWPQPGMPNLRGAAGLEVIMPREGVRYHSIALTQAAAVSSEALFRAQVEEAGRAGAEEAAGGDADGKVSVITPQSLMGKLIKRATHIIIDEVSMLSLLIFPTM